MESTSEVERTDGGPGQLASVPFLRSRWATVTLPLAAAVLVLSVQTTGSSRAPSQQAIEAERCRVVKRWRSVHSMSRDLQVIETTVSFRGLSTNFVREQGVVVVPVGLELQSAQQVIAVHATPTPRKIIAIDGIRNVIWHYPGKIMRDMKFVAWTLVKRSPARPAALPAEPSFETLPDSLALDATLPAGQLREHKLHSCAAFAGWVAEHAGPPPYPEQLRRIAETLRAHRVEPNADAKVAEDVCAAIRTKRFSAHQAHVALTLAGRQLGAPTLGLNLATHQASRAVATYVDALGWVSLRLWDSSPAWQAGGIPIVTRAPLMAEFDASPHGYWSATGRAYRRDFMGNASTFSYTSWGKEDPDADVTHSHSWRLHEVCL